MPSAGKGLSARTPRFSSGPLLDAAEPGGVPPATRCAVSSRVVLKLLAFVLPLGLDSFAVAAAIGAAAPTGWRTRLRISAIFVMFEAGMPLIGLAAGRGVAPAVGPVADYLAAAAVGGVGGLGLLGCRC